MKKDFDAREKDKRKIHSRANALIVRLIPFVLFAEGFEFTIN